MFLKYLTKFEIIKSNLVTFVKFYSIYLKKYILKTYDHFNYLE